MIASVFAAAAVPALGSAFALTALTATVLVVIVSIAAAYEVLSRPAPLQTYYVDVDNQTEEIEPGVRRRRYVTGKKPSLEFEVPDTTYDVFTRGMKVSNDGECLGWREHDTSDPKKLTSKFTWLTYSQVRQRAHNLGAALIESKRVESAGDTNADDKPCFVGIYVKNSVEWFVAAQACHAYRLVPVPLYDTLGVEAIGYILKQVRMTVIVVDGESAVEKVLKASESENGPLKMIVHINVRKTNFVSREDEEKSNLFKINFTQPINSNSTIVEKCSARSIQLVSFAEMEQRGSQCNRAPTPVKPDDLYMICYTSGTTGNPKGVMLTHRAVTACLRQCLESFLPFQVDAGEPVLSYLPLAHMYEHMVNLATLVNGCKIGIFSGSVLTLVDDMQILKPKMMAMVPRILNRLYQKTMANVQGSFVKRTLLRLALHFKIREIRQGIYRKNSIWDFLVFRRIQNALGGNLDFVTIGSAPIAGKIKDFTCAALGAIVLEGYGQTESVGAITFTLLQDDQPGQAGPPTEGVLMKLEDVHELDYDVERDGVGEVLVKSPMLMRGYFRDEERTRETVDKDGWLHTGDIGRWTPRGAIQIVDRKKHLFKLAQGEYVAPEKVENVLQQCKAVGVILVEGNSLETFTVAVVAPDVEYVKSWCNANGYACTSADAVARLCANTAQLKNHITDELGKYGKQNGLNSIEIPKRILLVAPDAFSVENGTLTPTMKLKRPDVRKKYKVALEELYAKSDADN